MNNYPHPLIARKGWFVLGMVVSVAIVVALFSVAWSIVFWILALLVLQYFRDSGRIAPQKPNTVLSPADGHIVVVEKTQDPYVGREALRLGVFMNVFNVHSNRAPVDGTIESVQYFPGKFSNGVCDEASRQNERNALTIKATDGQIITCVQVAGWIMRRILCKVKAGDMLSRGQLYGFIRFGSRVDIYLPLTATLKVTVGDRVSATETILAEL